jgi:putative hydrolase of the HAD superfamily
MSIVVFDLDDTLYEELTYVKSGFKAVATFLNASYDVHEEEAFSIMEAELEASGRGRIFNIVLEHFHLLSMKRIHQCLMVYRMHQPQIQLLPDAERCLTRLNGIFPTYIVTDGNKQVQDRKLRTLSLYNRVQFCYITHRYGVKSSKPSPYIFHKICERENVSPDKVIYIGDNPHKDFVGIKPAGFKTVRILRGNFAEIIKPEPYEAIHRIHSLDELSYDFVKSISE